MYVTAQAAKRGSAAAIWVAQKEPNVDALRIQAVPLGARTGQLGPGQPQQHGGNTFQPERGGATRRDDGHRAHLRLFRSAVPTGPAHGAVGLAEVQDQAALIGGAHCDGRVTVLHAADPRLPTR